VSTSPTVLQLKQFVLVAAAILLSGALAAGQNKSEKAKLPKPTILEKTVRVVRDPVTGELGTGTVNGAAEIVGATPPIRARVALVW
jgi:hypothetical protein